MTTNESAKAPAGGITPRTLALGLAGVLVYVLFVGLPLTALSGETFGLVPHGFFRTANVTMIPEGQGGPALQVEVRFDEVPFWGPEELTGKVEYGHSPNWRRDEYSRADLVRLETSHQLPASGPLPLGASMTFRFPLDPVPLNSITEQYDLPRGYLYWGRNQASVAFEVPVPRPSPDETAAY